MMEFMDEALLLSEIRKDNEDAFAFLFKKSFPRLLGYAVRFVENEEVALDIVQECFLNFWEKRNLLVAVSVTSLLFAMVRNSCLNYLKHRLLLAFGFRDGGCACRLHLIIQFRRRLFLFPLFGRGKLHCSFVAAVRCDMELPKGFGFPSHDEAPQSHLLHSCLHYR